MSRRRFLLPPERTMRTSRANATSGSRRCARRSRSLRCKGIASRTSSPEAGSIPKSYRFLRCWQQRSRTSRSSRPASETRRVRRRNSPAFATYPCLLEHENAAYCTGVLERLHADGRLGAYWWCWADYAADVCDERPSDRAPHERTFGIVRSDGSEKPVAVALAAFARQRRTVVEPNDMPMIGDHLLLPDAADEYENALRRVPEIRARTA